MILTKDIIREDNSLLRLRSSDVTIPISVDDERLLNEMMEYLVNSVDEEIAKEYDLRPGVGLAAPQLGVNKKMIAISAFDEEGREHFYMMVNPKLISYSTEMTYLENGEGCLSIDRSVEGLVHRARRVVVETYLYEDGRLRKTTLRLKGYIAVVFQHEYDHLCGILFVDHIKPDNPFFVPDNSIPVRFKFEDLQDDEQTVSNK